MAELKYRNPSYVEGGEEPKWITLGSASSDSGSGDTGNGDTGSGDNGGDSTDPVVLTSFVRVNQNITDPATMISGDIKGEAIQAIRDNSHRYLGKYTAEGTMTVCQLDDADSNYYSNGAKAYLDGAEGDVFMKLPQFWWKCYEEEEGSNVWILGFAYGGAPDDTWNEWAGDELIGVFLASPIRLNSGGKPIYSKVASSVAIVSSISVSLTVLKERGEGYDYLKLRHYNILRLLYLAYYGNTDSQSILGNGYNETTSLTSLGMADSVYDGEDNQYVHLWGISSPYTSSNSTGVSVYELISNVAVGSDTTKAIVTEDNGTTREIRIESGSTYIKELVFGECGDCLPKNEVDAVSATTGYCDMKSFSSLAEGDVFATYSPHGGGAGLFALINTSTQTQCKARITFKGTIIEETDVETFRLIEITN